MVKVKVKQSRYRPGVAQRKLSFRDFMTTAQDSGRVVSPMHRPPLLQEMHQVLIYVGG